MQISSQLRSDLANTNTEDGFPEAPVVTRHPATITEVREHWSKNHSGPATHLMSFRLRGGRLEGTVINDYQAINHGQDNIRAMSMKRLKMALAATGCEGATDTAAMEGKQVLITTKDRLDKAGKRQVNITKIEKDDGTGTVEAPAPGYSVAPGAAQPAAAPGETPDGKPGFMRR